MSDSGSDSGSTSSGSASSRRPSVQQENEPKGDAIDSNKEENHQEPGDDTADAENDVAEDEFTYNPDEQCLFVEYDTYVPPEDEDADNQGGTASEPERLHIDFVVVPGVYSSHFGPIGISPGSGTSLWVPDLAREISDQASTDSAYPKGSSRALRFQYDQSEICRGRRSRETIHKKALQLLQSLRYQRKAPAQKSLIYFITHDIGGTIVKDALVTAALNRDDWGDISDMTRAIIFNGCPHRSFNKIDLEDRLTRFLFEHWQPGISALTPSASSIPGLAEAVDQINGLFIESKVPLRSWIFSVHSQIWETGNIHTAFDDFGGTLGLPLEKRILDPTASDYEAVKEALKKAQTDLEKRIEPAQYHQERTLLALASPIYPLKSVEYALDPIFYVSEYQTWLRSSSPRILYVHGDKNVQDTAEQIFYSLEHEAVNVTRRAIVLYFSFDRWDVRCDSIRDMIATFVAQIANHFPLLTDSLKSLFHQLDKERGWTETDLVQFFELFRTTDEIEQTMIVINHFDECTAGSRKRFLDNIINMYDNDETPWKIVVTSHKKGALTEELSGDFCVPIDISELTNGLFPYDDINKDFARLSKERPDLLQQEDKVREELDFVYTLEPHLRHVVYEQARIRREWPDETSIKDIFSSIDFSSAGADDDATLRQVLNLVLKEVPDQAMLHGLLTWLVYAVRPMTIWELATALSFGTDQVQEDLSPRLSFVESLTDTIQHRLAGIIEIDHNEVIFQLPRLQSILLAEGPSDKEYVWNGIKDTAHSEIASLCLKYLSNMTVQAYVGQTLQVTKDTTAESLTFLARTNLVSYAAQAWIHHYCLSSPSPDISDLKSQPILMKTLAEAHWALANPITKSFTPYETLFPIFAGLGRQDVLEPKSDADAFQGMLEAGRKRQEKVMWDLLEKYTLGESQRWDLLKATSSSGKEDMIIRMLDHVLSKIKNPKEIEWPPVLLYRAVWLNLDRLVEKILTLECFPDPDPEYAAALKASPLYLAARNGHVKTVKLLLKYGADLEFRGSGQKTPFHVAAARGHTEVVRTIVEEGKIDLEITSDQKFTPFYVAAVWGHYKTAEFLLDKGADPNMGIPFDSEDDSQWSPLIVTTEDGFKRCVKLILDRGANPNICGPSGPALWWAVSCGRLEILNMLLEAGADPKSDRITSPLLAEAVGWDTKTADIPMLERLMELDLDANAKASNGTPILVHTIHSFPTEIRDGTVIYMPDSYKHEAIQRFLGAGADPNLTDDNGQAALLYAATNDQIFVVEMLLEAGADVDQKNRDGLTPLMASLKNPQIVSLLLERKANPDGGMPGDWTNLTSAAYYGHTESVRLLLEYGATVDLVYGEGAEELESPHFKGWTALMCAASRGYSDIVRLLADAGANMQVRGDNLQQPAIHTATFGGSLAAFLEYSKRIDLEQVDVDNWTALHHPELSVENLKLLVRAGANIEAVSDSGDTPLTVAARTGWGEYEAIEFLVNQGANVNHSSHNGSPLSEACRAARFSTMQFLVKKGANVNQIIPAPTGTPLQALLLRSRYHIDPFDVENMVRFLLDEDKIEPHVRSKETRADVTLEAGWFGYAINVAALADTPEIINLILDQEGATINVKDPIGRMPIHFAALNGIRNFQLILDRGGDIHAKDKLERSVLHYAAQGTCLQVVEKVLELLGDKVDIDVKDVDGWTPLCFAARGPASVLQEEQASEQVAQAEVMKLLMERGANKKVVVKAGDVEWTPLDIARYYSCRADIIPVLEEDEPSKNDERDGKFKIGTWKLGWTCDACLVEIRGHAWSCQTCKALCFCFKCYGNRALIHSPDHEFVQSGEEEYPEGQEEAAASSSSSSSSSSSDSGSDS